MMTPRRVVGLLVGAAVVIAVAFWWSSRGQRHDVTVAGQPVLDGLKASVNDVTELRLSKGDGTRVVLKKLPQAWEVADRGYPADSGKVRKLLLDLGSMQVVEEKTSEPASYERIGVEDVKSPKAGGTQVEAVTPKKVYSVIAGRASGTKSTYVRVTGVPKSFLASPQIMPDANPKQWLERNVVDIPEARIKEVVVTPASGPAYTVSRDKKEQTDFAVSGVPKGRELSSPSAGNSVAGELTSLTLDDVRKAVAGSPATASSAPPAAGSTKGATDGAGIAVAAKNAASKVTPTSAVFRTFDGLELQVTGQKDGERHYISISPRSTAKETAAEASTLESHVKGWDYEIPGYKYDVLFKPLDDLLKKPEPKEDKKAAGKKPAAMTLPPSPTS